ncbi:MAG: hypothetical protein ACR2PS_15010 [Pseudomonadales bacterium]
MNTIATAQLAAKANNQTRTATNWRRDLLKNLATLLAGCATNQPDRATWQRELDR